MGLAAADTLPDSVQEVAHTTLAKVGVHVPPGHERYDDPVVCPGGPYENHGAYVRSHKNDPNAGASPCGKPIRSLTGADGSTKENGPDAVDPGDDADGTGPPPWAHGSGERGKSGEKAKDKKVVAQHGKRPDAVLDEPLQEVQQASLSEPPRALGVIRH